MSNFYPLEVGFVVARHKPNRVKLLYYKKTILPFDCTPVKVFYLIFSGYSLCVYQCIIWLHTRVRDLEIKGNGHGQLEVDWYLLTSVW